MTLPVGHAEVSDTLSDSNTLSEYGEPRVALAQSFDSNQPPPSSNRSLSHEVVQR
ncbi:MAG: hypothetical protein AAF355_06030 [Myxococcota bacterium]